ncbi:DUF5133 domain-containing protein [Streptomyces sp. NPDC001812]|uniref:DUF5133 domain-containing protein n=1 Tax=Streptomyces cathayae TaxID=3031124 RepID=A0ABY8KE41_9ACTN|nr:DUF5133 domain-containing protein [Streptomyces sp. HUAS 5]WGD44572.1 DUF5133 domain-containing protein [Streptomyces sp. HUAS 5]
MLLPARAEVARQLRRYRAWERVMLAAPTDRTVRTTFEDSGYTLCVLMGKRCAREAADAAERYLRTSLVTYLQEQSERTRPSATAWPGPVADDRPRPAAPARRAPPSIERRSPAGR